MQQAGQGNFTWGYFGGLMDAATGLIYVGEGQYYDPRTGRFLTRGAQPGKANPYVPWGGDPTGLLVGPLALMVLLRWKKRGGKLGRMERVLLVALVLVAVGVAVAGCGNPPPSPTPIPPSDTDTPEPPTQPPSPTGGPGNTDTPAPTPTPNGYNRADSVNYAQNLANDYNGEYLRFSNDCTNFVSQALYKGGIKDNRD